MSTGDELRAAVAARRDLGPEYEDAVVDSFLDKMSAEIDRRVDERLAHLPRGKDPAQQTRSEGMRLALAIVSLVLGIGASLALLIVADEHLGVLVPIWLGIVLVNLGFNRFAGDNGSGRDDRRS
ncbi:hypothetical protein OIE66_10380 [Nonomuraea sp. NBC_01738]|uniref:hypothetical protein n=1 Tax=Nonomuraea sp. NBC_01738 TaxID=2976003 RepID=UPI002E0EE7E3|nr:hypothetical protein OIE66_10380 [Nonomuraea sp. NBC_01738]